MEKDLHNSFHKIKLITSSILFLIFSIQFSLALGVEIKCPEKVYLDEEFECKIIAKDLDKIYDVKADISTYEKNIARIFDPLKDKFKSSYYYLSSFLDKEEKTIKLKITEDYEGDLDCILKLRNNSKTESFEFKLNILEPEESSNNSEEENKQEESEEQPEIKNKITQDKNSEPQDKLKENTKTKSKKTENKDLDKAQRPKDNPEPKKDTNIINLNSPEKRQSENIINLNPQQDIGKELIYKSKNQKISDYAVYAFSFFLLFIIVILLIKT